MEVGKKYFEELIDEMKAKKGVTSVVGIFCSFLVQGVSVVP
jgi:hypothetical protein